MSFFELFNAHEPNRIAMFARFFCAVQTIQLLLNFGQQYRYFQTQPWRIYGRKQKLLGFIPLPALNQCQFLISGVCLFISLVLVSVAFYPYLFVLLALISHFLYFPQIISLAYVQRKTNLLPIVLFILLASPSLNKPLSAPSTGWEILLIKIALVQVYFSAGVQKLSRSGMAWFNGKYLQAYLLENYLWTDRTSALAVAGKPLLCVLMSTLTLVFELTFWVVIFFPKLIFLYVAIALLFHIGTLVTMRINYLKYLSPVYLVFFTDIAFHIKTSLGL